MGQILASSFVGSHVDVAGAMAEAFAAAFEQWLTEGAPDEPAVDYRRPSTRRSIGRRGSSTPKSGALAESRIRVRRERRALDPADDLRRSSDVLPSALAIEAQWHRDAHVGGLTT